MARILILTLNYAPEPTGFAPHTTALAEFLASGSHDVTVVTGFPFAPRWARWPAYRREFRRTETINGVRVLRISHFIPRRPGRAAQRILMEGTFAASGFLSAIATAVRRGNPDLIIYTGAQPAIAWAARLVAALYRVPYVVKITDLAAQAARDVGMTRAGGLSRVLERIEYGAYSHAQAAIVLCSAFRTALVDRGFPSAAIHLIRDSVDLDAIRPGGDGRAFRQRHRIGAQEFVVLFAGSLGLKQGLSQVAEAAALLSENDPPIRWVIVGEGEARPALAASIAAAGVGERVLLLPLQPEPEMSDMFAAADVLLLSQLRSVKDTVIPSKLLMYMAAGRPVLAAVNGASQAAEIVQDAGCGRLVEPESAAALAAGVRQVAGMRGELASMGARSRAYAERYFDRSAILAAQKQVIEVALDLRQSGADTELSAGRL